MAREGPTVRVLNRVAPYLTTNTNYYSLLDHVCWRGLSISMLRKKSRSKGSKGKRKGGIISDIIGGIGDVIGLAKPPKSMRGPVAPMMGKAVNLGNSIQITRPDAQVATTGKSKTVVHSEQIGSVRASSEWAREVFAIQPKESFVPFSSIESKGWTNYLYGKLQYRYVPRVNATVTGKIQMAAVLDPTNPLPTSSVEMSTIDGAVQSNAYVGLRMTVPRVHLQQQPGGYFVKRSAHLVEGAPLNLVDVGNFIVASEGFGDNVLPGDIVGDLFCDYVLVFMKAQISHDIIQDTLTFARVQIKNTVEPFSAVVDDANVLKDMELGPNPMNITLTSDNTANEFVPKLISTLDADLVVEIFTAGLLDFNPVTWYTPPSTGFEWEVPAHVTRVMLESYTTNDAYSDASSLYPNPGTVTLQKLTWLLKGLKAGDYFYPTVQTAPSKSVLYPLILIHNVPETAFSDATLYRSSWLKGMVHRHSKFHHNLPESITRTRDRVIDMRSLRPPSKDERLHKEAYAKLIARKEVEDQATDCDSHDPIKTGQLFAASETNNLVHSGTQLQAIRQMRVAALCNTLGIDDVTRRAILDLWVPKPPSG